MTQNAVWSLWENEYFIASGVFSVVFFQRYTSGIVYEKV